MKYQKDFAAISKHFLPHPHPNDLALYFYDVWKARLIAQAQAWYSRKEVTIVCASLASLLYSTHDNNLVPSFGYDWHVVKL